MGMTNIERMVEALVRDEMNYVRSMSMKDMDAYIEELIRAKYESLDNDIIIEEYEALA